jgi:diadenosine hexaphosphate hydrolase (ATP-forming)
MHSPPTSAPPSHAGGIVFREDTNEARYLLVTARNHNDEWVFPKGHIDPGEDAFSAALREVREETGVVAKIVDHVGTISFVTERERATVSFFLMERMFEQTADEGRTVRWFSLREAEKHLVHPENVKLLYAAEAIRRPQPSR